MLRDRLRPPVFGESARATPFHRHHIIERYGLLLIISPGEIMLSIALGFGALFEDHSSLHAAMVSVSALVIVFAIWWVSFCEQAPLASTRLPVALVWGCGHQFIFMATAALGAAVAAMVDVVTVRAKVAKADVAHRRGASPATGSLALWVTRDRVVPPPAWRSAALPVLAPGHAAAALAGAPIRVFAVLAVAGVVWRAPVPRTPAM